ncbi:S9 family peptidase [Homoserinibacter sp. YIM 151385]|uniref:S9 family peptidase n=1 Tax=Homoserinibacter sp. YIM 151385 TaxID=2985506 RepID=UPI0022EFF1BC|nr:S9 family peptidase [Homoserinibacter sp. YIM 151385]WBU38362.1 S9 family peptidase [Homoserinibacter sp. YIM 151385]
MTEAAPPLHPPRAERRPTRREHHGDLVLDDYEWLRAKDDPAVRAHLEAENAHTAALTSHLDILEELVFEEIRRRTKESDLSVPVREGGWWYYRRTIEGAQYGIRARVAAADTGDRAADWTPPALPEDGSAPEGEQVLLDGNAEAAGHEYFGLGSFDVSPDGWLLLWAVDTEGDERYLLRFRDLETGETLPDEVAGTAGGAFFDPSGRHAFYTTVDAAWRPDTVWRHELGSTGEDAVVLREDDERYWVGAGLTRSRRYIVVELGSKITSEVHLIDAAEPTGDPAVVWPRREGVEYDVEHAVLDGRDRLLIVHNEAAEDFELAMVDAEAPRGARTVLVPHERGRRIESVEAFAGHLALEYRREALPRVAVARIPDSGSAPAFEELRFEEELFSAGLGANPEWDAPSLRLGYGSFTTPSSVLSLDLATGERTVLKTQPVLGGYDPARYTQRRVWARADDGTRIPISLVYRDDLVGAGDGAPERPTPVHLYGYGSYETSIDPGFSIPRLSLLERGVVFAVAHVRGGGELGRHWYEQGKTGAKRNTFTDFAACARHLVDTGWTAPDRLVAEGGSAGGLLVGAVANLAPELFSGILAVVPFVDPLTSILDPELPLTVIEWDEWGNPLADPEIYALMKSYSPYENVADRAYPPILAVTSLNDTRVLYVEPAKWVARLREHGAPALLRCDMAAGHGGVSGRYDSWRKRAFEIAWILDRLGLHAGG